MSKKDDPEYVDIEGELKRIGIPRKPQPVGKSWSVTVPMKELVRQAIKLGMDVVDFVANYRLVFYEVTPEGGSWLRDGVTLVKWERRPEKKEKEKEKED